MVRTRPVALTKLISTRKKIHLISISLVFIVEVGHYRTIKPLKINIVVGIVMLQNDCIFNKQFFKWEKYDK